MGTQVALCVNKGGGGVPAPSPPLRNFAIRRVEKLQERHYVDYTLFLPMAACMSWGLICWLIAIRALCCGLHGRDYCRLANLFEDGFIQAVSS